jgi:hypothetical protein
MTDNSSFTLGMAKFVMAVSAFSTHLGKCSAVYHNMGVTVAAWKIGQVTVQHTDDGDDVYMHHATPSTAELVEMLQGRTVAGWSRELAGELAGYAGMEGISMGSPAPPKP